MSTSAAKKPFDAQYIEENWESTEPPVIDIPSLRSFLLKKCPFYTQALQRVDIIIVDEKTSCSFGWTNGFRVYINPRLYSIHGKYVVENGKTWFATPILGIAFTIMHEIGHIVFDSFGRVGHRDFRMWNIATDYQINQFVCKLLEQSSVFTTKESFTAFLKVINENLCFDPAKFEKLTSEGTYDDLYRVSVSRSGGGGGDKSMSGDMQAPEDDDLTDEEKMDRDIVKSELSNYAEKNASKLPGNGSGFREFEFMLEPPKVNLRQVLRHITTRECTDDWAFTSRGSRFDHMLPSNMRLPTIAPSNPDVIKKVFFILDSSGSLSSNQLNDALNIIKECLGKYTRAPVYLIIFTSDLMYSGDIKSHSELTEHYTGGTTYQVAIDELRRLKRDEHIEPSVIINFTDYFLEKDFQVEDFRGIIKPKDIRWIISGNPNASPTTGSTYFIDEIGS